MNNQRNIDCLIKEAVNKLSGDSPLLDAQLILRNLLAKYGLNVTRSKLLTMGSQIVSCEIERAFWEGVNQRACGIPIAYIIGKKEFYERVFNVTPDTLIPRPETELIVEKASEIAKKIHNPSILDIGTGSGNIIISLAGLLKSGRYDFYASDISSKALEAAKQNAKLYGEDGRIKFVISDILFGFIKEKRFDIILSNPPYISQEEYAGLSREVKAEPYSALVSGPSGLEIIEKIICQSKNYLKSRGYLLLEIGYNQSEAVRELLKKNGYTGIEFLKDLQGIKRAAVAILIERENYG